MCRKDTIQAYETFLKYFPSSPFREKAIRRLEELKDEKAWEKALKENSIPAYLNYIEKFPNGKYRKPALERIKKLQREEGITASTLIISLIVVAIILYVVTSHFFLSIIGIGLGFLLIIFFYCYSPLNRWTPNRRD